MLKRFLEKVVNVSDEEVSSLLLSTLYFFLLFAGYFIIRPLRDEMGMLGGVRDLAWLFTGTLVGMLVVHPIYTAMVARLPRRRFIPLIYRFFAANLLLFFILIRVVPTEHHLWIARVFFIWTSVFNLFVVSVFWSFMADVFRPDQAKRLFGFIAVGGTLGAVVGSATTAFLAERITPVNLLLVTVVLLEGAVQCSRRIQGESTANLPTPDHPKSDPEAAIGGGVLAGIAAVIRSPYLLGICAYLFCYTITATFLYFQQAEIVPATFGDDRAARTVFLARIDLAVNSLTALAQIFVTGRVLKRLGVAVSLAVLPVVCAAGFLTLAAMPTLAALATFQILRKTSNYAISRPGREVLFTVLPREQKYKAKNLIDTFVYRAGDQVGAWSYAAARGLGLAMTGLSMAAVPISAVWLAVAVWLGRRQRRLEDTSRPPGQLKVEG